MKSQRKMAQVICFGAAMVVGMWSPTAHAGVADSPVPMLAGKKTMHVFSIPGVQSTSEQLGPQNLETEFFCTSLEPSAVIIVSVEIFGYAGGGPLNNAVTSYVSLSPGQTATLATREVAAFTPDEIVPNLPPIPGGSARILSTSRKLMCTAIVTDSINKAPNSMTSLQVIKAKMQKGD